MHYNKHSERVKTLRTSQSIKLESNSEQFLGIYGQVPKKKTFFIPTNITRKTEKSLKINVRIAVLQATEVFIYVEKTGS